MSLSRFLVARRSLPRRLPASLWGNGDHTQLAIQDFDRRIWSNFVLEMRKRTITPTLHTVAIEQKWLDLERIASVEMTSEDKAFPIESALLQQTAGGWRAAEPGVQMIRLIFDQPQKLRHISLVFEETEIKRTQEFTLRWSPDHGDSFQEIVRQQWNFSAPDSVRENGGLHCRTARRDSTRINYRA